MGRHQRPLQKRGSGWYHQDVGTLNKKVKNYDGVTTVLNGLKSSEDTLFGKLRGTQKLYAVEVTVGFIEVMLVMADGFWKGKREQGSYLYRES